MAAARLRLCPAAAMYLPSCALAVCVCVWQRRLPFCSQCWRRLGGVLFLCCLTLNQDMGVGDGLGDTSTGWWWHVCL